MRVTVYKTMLDDEGMCRLVKEKAVNYAGERKMNEPERVYRLLCDVFQLDKQTEEYLYLLCLDSGCNLQGVFELSHGTVNMTLVSCREIFQKALLCNASCIVTAHNHPSGELSPSKQDLESYRAVRKAADIMGIQLLDNIIVGKHFYSFHSDNVV